MHARCALLVSVLVLSWESTWALPESNPAVEQGHGSGDRVEYVAQEEDFDEVLKKSMEEGVNENESLIAGENDVDESWPTERESNRTRIRFAGFSTSFRVARVFTNNAVLQRGKNIPVWGWAPPGNRITVSFRGSTASTTANGNGEWRVTLPPKGASRGDTISITNENSRRTIRLNNVATGEVWVCSGQSNMAYPPKLLQGQRSSILSLSNPNSIRLFLVAPRESDTLWDQVSTSGWTPATPNQVDRFSSACYVMGYRLAQWLKNVIVGLISTARNSTPIQAWLPSAEVPGAPGRPEGIEAVAPFGYGTIANAMLAPLAPYAIKGFAWYQGENNLCQGYYYRVILEYFISAWRRVFAQGNFPLIIVQLAPSFRNNYSPGNAKNERWATLRDSQSFVAKHAPNAGLVVTIDKGVQGMLHPILKRPVGERMALVARKLAYGDKGVVASGPYFNSKSIKGNRVYIKLGGHGGLRTTHGSVPTGFIIAGANKHWYIADAEIVSGSTVVVSAPEVPSPKEVRYAWGDNPPVNLIDGSNLPALPFRTDTWPIATVCSAQGQGDY